MSQDFWVTEEGINLRSQMLAQFVITRTWNKATQKYAPLGGIKSFRFTNQPHLTKTGPCILCRPYDGRVYRTGQFMKYQPVHPRCVCIYDAIMETYGAAGDYAPISQPMSV